MEMLIGRIGVSSERVERVCVSNRDGRYKRIVSLKYSIEG